ncbi:hypothetical protein HZB07_04590 [Candidatus Saganbacteria bacterium]|nr:hypothetical protein [Candidatus Saganbacteria bacterium]
MRIVCSSLLLFVLASVTLAVSDSGLLAAKKTFGYFVMPATDFANYSSGLSVSKWENNGQALQFDFLAYRSPYLLTKNITKAGIHQNYRLLQFGPLELRGAVGGSLVYSPAVGGGLAADLGGTAIIKPLDYLSFSLPINTSIFNDGSQINVSAIVSYLPWFLSGKEIFGGVRIDASVLNASLTSATTATYFAFGLRSEM